MENLSIDAAVTRLENWTGDEPIETAVGFFSEICKIYRTANEEQRAALRQAVQRNPRAYACLLYDSNAWVGLGPYLAWSKENAQHDFAAYFQTALIVFSLTGGFGDSRDSLLWLDNLWTEAEKQGIDPKPHFEEVAALSDTRETRHPIFGGSTKGLILQLTVHSPLTGKLRTAEAPIPADSSRPASKKKPWWKFW
jgi:hypothetical protein